MAEVRRAIEVHAFVELDEQMLMVSVGHQADNSKSIKNREIARRQKQSNGTYAGDPSAWKWHRFPL
jgi:hypothetical protein